MYISLFLLVINIFNLKIDNNLSKMYIIKENTLFVLDNINNKTTFFHKVLDIFSSKNPTKIRIYKRIINMLQFNIYNLCLTKLFH